MEIYQRDLNPTLQRFTLLLHGIDTLDFDEDSSHCEIEFGDGLSLNIHAAASEEFFVGTDSNPANAFRANKMRDQFSKELTWFRYDSIGNVSDIELTHYNSIAIHENFSRLTIEDQNRILNFVRKLLRPGGIFYINYDSFPGCSTKNILRKIVQACPIRKVQNAIDFVREFIETKTNFWKTMPAFKPLFEYYSKRPELLEREFLSKSWRGFYFTEICEMLNESQLEFACPMDLLDTNQSLEFTIESRNFLQTIENPIAREELKDFFLNRTFRNDLFVRGKSRLTQDEFQRKIDSTRFILLTTENISNEFQTPIGIAKLDSEMLEKLIEFLRADQFQPKSFLEIKQNLGTKNLLQMIIALIHRGLAAPCQNFSPRVKKQCESLNSYLIQRRIRILASPITGGGISCEELDLKILDRMKFGRNDPVEIAQALEIEEDIVRKFFNDRLPLFRALKIV